MIDRALLLLARLRFRGWLRRLGRSLSTPRGIALFVVGLFVMFSWLLPVVLRGGIRQPSDPEQVAQAAPLWMLGITLMMVMVSGGGKIISFTPADVNFLFPGPFSRHQLVLYKIGVSAFASLWAALIFSIWRMRYTNLWLAAFSGVWLYLVFAQCTAIVILLARKSITARRSLLPVRIGMALVLSLVIWAVLDIARILYFGNWDLEALPGQARESLPLRIVLAPFDVLTLAFTAQRVYPDLLKAASLSAGMIAVLIGLILLLDLHFIETALGATESLQARLKRMRRGGGAFAAARPVARLRLAMLPRLGGAGTLAWRQLLTALRGARGLLTLLIVLVIGLGPMLWAMSRPGSQTARPVEVIAPLLGFGGIWLMLVLPSMLRFDFRGDLSHIETLKLLPLPPSVVAVGQMLAPVVIITLTTWLLAGIVCVAVPDLAAGGGIAIAAAPPLILLVIGLENAVFLMFPLANTAVVPGDMTHMGRTMVIWFVKMVTLATALGLATGAGALAHLVSGSWLVAIAVGWIIVAAFAAATVPVVAILFERFDPSVDKPPD